MQECQSVFHLVFRLFLLSIAGLSNITKSNKNLGGFWKVVKGVKDMFGVTDEVEENVDVEELSIEENMGARSWMGTEEAVETFPPNYTKI